MMRGFSLIEVIIAMAILAVGIFGAIRIFPVGLQASRRSEASSRAAMAASRALESLKLKDCADIAEEESAQDDLTLKTRVTQPVIPHLADGARVKGVELTVTWKHDVRTRSQSFISYVRCVPST